MPRRLRPDPVVAARRADVERLTIEGLCSTDIAKELSLPVHLVWADAHWNKVNGKVQRSRKSMAGSDNATFIRASKVPIGTMAEMVALFSPDEVAWLIRGAPKGARVADLVAAIVKDAYAEAQENRKEIDK